MGTSFIQLLVLAGIALFLFFRLRDTLGTRGGFEPDLKATSKASPIVDVQPSTEHEDDEISDFVEPKSVAAKALSAMKRAESDFDVGDFLNGSKAAYEMILMAFEEGNLNDIEALVDDAIMDSFSAAVSNREDLGLKIEATFIGFRSLKIVAASFTPKTKRAEISVSFTSEITSVVRNAKGKIVDGDPKESKRQTDIWTFARDMGSDNVNWLLIATSE